MAKAIVCDKCGTVGAQSQLITFLEREFEDQHDGIYKTRVRREYDLCDKCANEIELSINKFADALTVYVSEDGI